MIFYRMHIHMIQGIKSYGMIIGMNQMIFSMIIQILLINTDW